MSTKPQPNTTPNTAAAPAASANPKSAAAPAAKGTATRPATAARATTARPAGSPANGTQAQAAAAAQVATRSKADAANKQAAAQKQENKKSDEAPPPVVAHHRYWWQRLGSGAVSAMVHAGLFVALAVWTMALPQEAPKSDLVATVSDSITPDEVPTPPVQQQLDIPEQNTAVAAAIPMGSPINPASIATANAPSDMGDLGLTGPVLGDVDQLFGANGTAMADVGVAGNSASFFGVRVEAKRIVYVCDLSGSMKGGKFEGVINELLYSVEGLKPSQSFYIVFFGNEPYPMFYPNPINQMLPGTEKSRYMLKQWLDIAPVFGSTKGEDAMKMALALKPEVIFILGDGAFTDKTTKMMLELRNVPVMIHTIGLGLSASSKAADDLKSIAAAFKGTYTEVPVTDEMNALAKKVKRTGSWPSTFVPQQ